MASFLRWLACAVVLLGVCMPWVSGSGQVILQDGKRTISQSSDYSVTGLSARATVAGLSIPGWCIGVSVLLTAILKNRRLLGLALTFIGFCHVGFMAYGIHSTPQMASGDGLRVTAIGLALMVLAIWATPQKRNASQRVERAAR